MKTVHGTNVARFAGLSLALLMQAGGQDASAQMAASPRFQVDGLVIVWGADGPAPGGRAPIVSDFIVDTGTGDTAATSGDVDLINGDVHTVVSGSLVPVSAAALDADGIPIRVRNVDGGGFTFNAQPGATDLFDAFGLRDNSGIDTRRAELTSSFYVASNTAFAIDAEARPLGTTTAAEFNNIRLRLRVTESGNDGLAFGNAAQFPHSGGTAGGSRANGRRLSSLTTPRRVFVGNQATARVRGSIAQQSVRFDLRYRYNSGVYSLSDGIINASAEVTYTVYVP